MYHTCTSCKHASVRILRGVEVELAMLLAHNSTLAVASVGYRGDEKADGQPLVT